MASTVRVRCLFVMVGGLLAWGVAGPSALAARDVPSDSASGGSLYGCEQAVHHEAGGGLDKSTDPAPDSRVEPGQEIRAELSWSTGDWSEDQLHKVLDCVTLDGKLASALSGGEKPTANDGRFSHRYRVPADTRPGTKVCDVGFLSGPDDEEDFARAVSRTVCFTVEKPEGHSSGDVGPPATPVTPPAPAPVPPPPAELGGEQQVTQGGPPAPVAAAPAGAGPVLRAGEQLPRTGGTPRAGVGLASLVLAALARRGAQRR